MWNADRVSSSDRPPCARPQHGAGDRTVILVVDAANVVGSRPDGWWADRRGATVRLRDHLAAIAHEGLEGADAGLPGGRWYPEIVLVTEGRARGVEACDGVEVIDAPGGGDDEIVATVRRLREAQPAQDLAVATADRELQARVRALGARTLSPRLVRNPPHHG